MIQIPEALATNTITREGEAGRQWIAALPRLVQSLCADWNLTLDGQVMHGYLGLAIPVCRGMERCVLKVAWVDDTTADAALALALWNGHGAVRLLASQPARGAMLLERLDHEHSLQAVAIGEAVTIAGGLLRRLAIPGPNTLRTQSEQADTIKASLPARWLRYGRPMPRSLLDRVDELAGQLRTPSRQLVVNFDLHYDNVLAGTREPWLAIDPKVVVGDPEFGLAQLLWCRLEEMTASGGLAYHFDRLVEAAELDVELARAWTLVRCVDYWLWGLNVGLTTDPARCAVITEWLWQESSLR